MDQQLSFSDASYTYKKKTTRKERFLSEMDAVLPWDALLQTRSCGTIPSRVKGVVRFRRR